MAWHWPPEAIGVSACRERQAPARAQPAATALDVNNFTAKRLHALTDAMQTIAFDQRHRNSTVIFNDQ